MYPSDGGGAGGMIEHKNFSLTESSYEVVVGAGGAGSGNGQGTFEDGADGGDSRFGSNLFIAKGGGGGGYCNSVKMPGHSGGLTGGSSVVIVRFRR
jgi:hypothetical protein